MPLSSSQTSAIEITERVSSVLSLIGAAIIILTFLFDKGFRKPINRLVFYAAWGNILCNVATIISTAGIHGPASLCQFQGFLIQWFMPADALWTFAMACNVFLTFFRKYDAHQLRLLELKYFLFCYGTPFVPAFVYFFVHTPSRGGIYGSAVLWCWVSIKWDFLRIAVFYGPVWLIIIATLAIYLACGRVIFRWRSQLLSFARPPTAGSSSDNINIIKTSKTEIVVEHASNPEQPRYTATVSAGRHSRNVSAGPTGQVLTRPPTSRHVSTVNDSRKVTMGANKAAINYCRVALLFFVALCITWIPSTINRVYTLVHPETTLFSMALASGLVLPLQGFWNAIIYISTSWPACRSFMRRLEPSSRSKVKPAPQRQSVLLQAVGNITSHRSNSRAHTTESEEELYGDD